MTTSVLPRAFSSSSLTDAVFICVGATSYATDESGKTGSGASSISSFKINLFSCSNIRLESAIHRRCDRVKVESTEARRAFSSWKKRVNVIAACLQIVRVGVRGCWCKGEVPFSDPWWFFSAVGILETRIQLSFSQLVNEEHLRSGDVNENGMSHHFSGEEKTFNLKFSLYHITLIWPKSKLANTCSYMFISGVVRRWFSLYFVCGREEREGA